MASAKSVVVRVAEGRVLYLDGRAISEGFEIAVSAKEGAALEEQGVATIVAPGPAKRKR